MAVTEPAGESERTSNEIVTDLLTIVRDLASYTGGEYTYLDDTPFDPENTSGYPSQTCVGRQGNDINVNIVGPPAADIAAVQQEIIDAYTSRGWEVILREEADVPGESDGRVVR